MLAWLHASAGLPLGYAVVTVAAVHISHKLTADPLFSFNGDLTGTLWLDFDVGRLI